ncbi:hypothetical protein [uncultured Kordia sp.]|uniref:hypothetical protein n=1 Tax=uncultured Kordia sp. TaxID=507699 RepID=UPI002627158A|nr:hypothetical protein [uncultured Kordia sp.]
MKTLTRLFFSLCIITTMVSCGGEEKKTPAETKPVEEKKVEVKKEREGIKITMDFQTDQDDTFSGKYVRMEDKNQLINYEITQKVNTKNAPVTLHFDAFKDLDPEIIQIGLGNKKVKKVIIDKVTLSYNGTEIVVLGKDLKRYFVINKFADFDPETQTITTKKVGGRHVPVLIFKKPFLNKLLDLVE